MKPSVLAWFCFRVVRWLSWIGLVVYSVLFVSDRQSHLNSFGQLLHTTEAWMFGLALLAVFAGCLELMMREKAGLARPSLGRLMPPSAPTQSSLPVR